MNQPPPQADVEAVLRRIAAQYLLPRPDPEFEHTFRAYANYLEDLAGVIGGHHGMAESVVEGVYRSMELHPAVQRVRKRPLEPARRLALESALRKAWVTCAVSKESSTTRDSTVRQMPGCPRRPTTRSTTPCWRSPWPQASRFLATTALP